MTGRKVIYFFVDKFLETFKQFLNFAAVDVSILLKLIIKTTF